jgi:hypothetical protein
MTKEDDKKEIITIIMETDYPGRGFNVYMGIRAIGTISKRLQEREPDLFTPDMYVAVKFADEFADEYMRKHQTLTRTPRIMFILGEAAGVRQEGQQLVERVNPKPALAELCINLKEGQAVVSPEGTIEFCDTGMNISLQDLQFVVQEAEAYMKYREERIILKR